MADAVWYVGKGGQQLGPFTADDVKAKLASGEMAATDLAWKEGMAEWLAIGSLADFGGAPAASPGAPAAPPMPPSMPAAAAGPNPFAAFFTDLLGDLKAIAADPEQGIQAAADKKALPACLAWIGLVALLMGLLSLQVLALIPFPIGAGDLLKAFFKSLLGGLIAQGVLFGAVFVTLGPILNASKNWKDSLVIVALSDIPVVLVGLIIFVFAWLTGYAHGLWAGALPMSVLFLYEAFLHLSKAPKKAAMFAVPAICLATAIALGILMRIFAV